LRGPSPDRMTALSKRTRSCPAEAYNRRNVSMRTLLGMLMVVLLALAGCGNADRPRAESGALATDAPAVAPAQPGGTIEAGVKYTGEAVMESVTINKDVEQCGTTRRIQGVVVGPDNGLRDATVSVADAKAAATAKPASKPVLDQKGCEFHP